MSTELIVILAVTAALAVILIAYLAVKFYRHTRTERAEEPALLPEPALKIAEPVKEPELADEPEEEQPVQPAPAEATEEVAAAFAAEIGDVLDDEEDDREIFDRRTTFAEKMLALDVRTQEYYDELNNEFISYRKLHERVSGRFVSYRFGRKLVAKISVRGRTMKLHLALDCKDFEEKIYFQKDLSEVKSYAETPFTVKVKSDRGLKRAKALIEALALKEGMEKKTRTAYKDSMEEIRHMVMEKQKEDEAAQ